LRAYFEEFDGEDPVVLVLHTYLYGEREPRNKDAVMAKVNEFADSLKLNKTLAEVIILTDELPEVKMPQLYKACDAFVLPTRGEGWGLPVMEAMSMQMPVIVTNWSGPTEFATEDTAYLLPVDKLEIVPDNFPGTTGVERWAMPSVSYLKQLMRDIYTNKAKAQSVANKARQHIQKYYDREVVGNVVLKRLKEIKHKIG